MAANAMVAGSAYSILRLVRRLDAAPSEAVRWALVENLGKIRRRSRANGTVFYYLDFRPFGNAYSDEGQPLRTREAAENLLSKIRAKVALGKPLQAVLVAYKRDSTGHLAVHRFMADWLADLDIRRRAGDLSVTYTRNLERYAQPDGHLEFWREKTIHDISPAKVRDFGRWLALRKTRNRQGEETDQILSASTRRKVLGAFHAFCEWLRQGELINVVPPFPKIPKTEHQPFIISMEAQTAVLEAIPWEERGAFLAAACGARPGEVRAYDIDDPYQDDEGCWIRTNKAVQGQNTHEAAPRTKNRRAGDLPCSAELWEWILWRLDQVQPSDRLQGQIPLFINPTGRVAARRWLGNALRTRWNLYARQVLGVHVPMYEGTKHSTATDAIRRGVSLEQIQAALRHADAASTRVYAKLARSGSFDILRNPARVSHLYPDSERPEKDNENRDLWRGGRDSNPQLPA